MDRNRIYTTKFTIIGSSVKWTMTAVYYIDDAGEVYLHDDCSYLYTGDQSTWDILKPRPDSYILQAIHKYLKDSIDEEYHESVVLEVDNI